MCILYELGLFIARFYLPKSESPEEKIAWNCK
jgi:Sec-independent protein secretion pathway component TatC